MSFSYSLQVKPMSQSEVAQIENAINIVNGKSAVLRDLTEIKEKKERLNKIETCVNKVTANNAKMVDNIAKLKNAANKKINSPASSLEYKENLNQAIQELDYAETFFKKDLFVDESIFAIYRQAIIRISGK